MLRSVIHRLQLGSHRLTAVRSVAATVIVQPQRPNTPCVSFSTAAAKKQQPLSGGSLIAALTAENSNLDLVHYKHKNRTWTAQHINYYSEAVAIGLLETGLAPGDVVLSWLPNHLSEQMVLQFACSKAGMILYSLDPKLATTDRAKAQEALAAALTLTKANVLISQEAGSDVNYVQLAQGVIPELRIYDTSSGMPFITPRFPHLRLCIHTGFDQDDKYGWFPLRHMVVPSNNLEDHVDAATAEKQPLAGELVYKGDSHLPVSTKVHTHADIMKNNLWPTYVSILNKKFHEVEGVGVIF